MSEKDLMLDEEAHSEEIASDLYEDWDEDIDPDSTEGKIELLIRELSKNEQNDGQVYEALGVFFIIADGQLLGIPDDAGDTPRGGWFPSIVSGPTKAENEELERIMKKYSIDEYFFSGYLGEYSEYDEKSAINYFGEKSEVALATFTKLLLEVERSEIFGSMEDFILALDRYGLDEDKLFYAWEGEWIDLYDNIVDTGDGRGYYSYGCSDEEWLEVLENLDSYLVR